MVLIAQCLIIGASSSGMTKIHFSLFFGIYEESQYTILKESLTYSLKFRGNLQDRSTPILSGDRDLSTREELLATKHEAFMILNTKMHSKRIWTPKRTSKANCAEYFRVTQYLTKGLILRVACANKRGITGTLTYHRDEWQIGRCFERMMEVVNAPEYPLDKSASWMLWCLYPAFADGNKRTARMISNALLCHDHSVIPSVNENEYKESLILFFEQKTIFTSSD